MKLLLDQSLTHKLPDTLPTACEKQNREKQEISLLLRAGALGKQIQEERIDYFLERFNQYLQNITTLDELNCGAINVE
ncbi:MAG: hypothetical protein DI558_07835 [Corynebacterium propinquum]|nr:MAG: hypothetical protein DI558_07835 [Corynebacterium propinquum]